MAASMREALNIEPNMNSTASNYALSPALAAAGSVSGSPAAPINVTVNITGANLSDRAGLKADLEQAVWNAMSQVKRQMRMGVA
jgi:hypothetical protein